MPKNNRHGQAAVFDARTFRALLNATKCPRWRLFYQIAWHTGERSGAISQLKVLDVYDPSGKCLKYITFPAHIRKHDIKGRSKTRQVFINPTLKAILSAYRIPKGVYLFPGGFGDRPIKKGSVQAAFRRNIARAGLDSAGFSTHSFRRTFITRLANNGTDIKVMQKITGHKDIKALLGYVEVNEDQVESALTALS